MMTKTIQLRSEWISTDEEAVLVSSSVYPNRRCSLYDTAVSVGWVDAELFCSPGQREASA